MSVVAQIEPALEEAAASLRATRWTTFRRVILPLAWPGIVSGSTLVFILTVSAFVTPRLVGGPRVQMLGSVIYEQVLAGLNWPFGAAMSLVLLALVLALIGLSSVATRHCGAGPVTTRAVLPGVGAFLRGLVYVWLALPAAIVVASSFSRSLTSPFHRRDLPSSGTSAPSKARLSWQACWSAQSSPSRRRGSRLRRRYRPRSRSPPSLCRSRSAPGRADVAHDRPLIVLAIGLLQLLTWLGLAGSFLGLLIGHAVITLPYAVRTIGASLSLFDRSLEEAAASLRATPLQVVRWVTLPVLLPGILSAAIFCFVTSFGNVTLSMFLAKSGQTTLPVQIFTYVETFLRSYRGGGLDAW